MVVRTASIASTLLGLASAATPECVEVARVEFGAGTGGAEFSSAKSNLAGDYHATGDSYTHYDSDGNTAATLTQSGGYWHVKERTGDQDSDAKLTVSGVVADGEHAERTWERGQATSISVRHNPN